MRAATYVAVVIAGTVFASFVAVAWTGPSASPPDNNVSAPVNVGATSQTKNGALGVNSLAVFGNTLPSGSSRYLNWGTTAGSGGYGIRDVSGTLQFKNTGGSWQTLQTAVTTYVALGAGGWTTSGNNIYNSNSGNVGTGATSPGQKLDVSGTVRATSFVYSSDARLKDVPRAKNPGRSLQTSALTKLPYRPRAQSCNASTLPDHVAAMAIEAVEQPLAERSPEHFLP
jgi:hypothetical protein